MAERARKFPMLEPALRRNLILSMGGGVLASLAFPNPMAIGLDWPGGVLAFICLIPLLAIRESNSPRRVWRWGYIYGMVYFGMATIWVASMESLKPLSIPAWLALTAYLALYPAVFMSLYHRLLKLGIPTWSMAPCLWVSLEFLRNTLISGFPWVALGYAHYRNPFFLAMAPVTGLWGLSLFTALVNTALYQGLSGWLPALRGQDQGGEKTDAVKIKPPVWKNLRVWTLLVLVVMVGIGMAHERNQLQRDSKGQPIKVAVLQGSVNQNQIWDEAYQRKTLKVFSGLIAESAAQGAQLVVWPETAFPGIFNLDFSLVNTLKQWSRTWSVSQLVGSDHVELAPDKKEYLYFNSIFFMDSVGEVHSAVSKVHLVPFGEYVPFKDSIFALIHKVVRRYGGAGFTPAAKRKILTGTIGQQATTLGALICFESIFPQYAAQLTRMGGEFLVVITYDTWFGRTAAPAQHAICSALRAAETGRDLVRAAANGISGIFNPYGQMVNSLALDEVGVLVGTVQLRHHLTWYVRFGDWIVGVAWIVLAVELLAGCTRLRRMRLDAEPRVDSNRKDTRG